MPPKKKKKTKEEEEEEARLEQERLAELARLQEIERQKFAIEPLENGTEQILTKYCIENVWDHKTPKVYLQQFLIRQLKTLQIIGNFEMMDIQIVTEFCLYNLIFAKDKLGLDDQKSVIFLNLMLQLLKFNNAKFNNKSKKLGPQEIEADEYLESLFQKPDEGTNENRQSRELTLSSDLEFFTELLRKHSYENPPQSSKYFTAQQTQNILEYAQNTYFKHFNLYKYCQEEKQLEQQQITSIMIDEPQLMDALGDFEEIIEIKQEQDETAQDLEKDETKQDEDMDKEDEKEVELDDFDRLDPEIKKMIEQKITETEDVMRKEVLNRQSLLDEKLDEILNPNKDKGAKKKK